MDANRKPFDICNAQGYDAEELLAEMNRTHAQLAQSLSPFLRQQQTEYIEILKMVLKDSGHLVSSSESGYDFERRRTGPL